MIPKDKKDTDLKFNFQKAVISSIKNTFKNDMFLWADVCLCSMTTHGHCCLFDNKKNIDLSSTLSTLSKIALNYAEAGVDGIAPSDMMDGRTASIRKILDNNYEVKIFFSGGSVITLILESIEIVMHDLGEAWNVKHIPTHKI